MARDLRGVKIAQDDTVRLRSWGYAPLRCVGSVGVVERITRRDRVVVSFPTWEPSTFSVPGSCLTVENEAAR